MSIFLALSLKELIRNATAAPGHLETENLKGRENDGYHSIWNTHSWTALDYSFLYLHNSLPLSFIQPDQLLVTSVLSSVCVCAKEMEREEALMSESDGYCCLNTSLGCIALRLCTFFKEAHASPEYPPTSVFRDYLTAAVLASSNSLVHKRVKPYQVVEL